MTRFPLALAALGALALGARAADLPTGTWAANINDTKGELVIKEVKAGKVTGSLNGTDFTGALNGKELTFEIGADTYEARLVTEPGEKGQIKYTLTGTRAQASRPPTRLGTVHLTKTGWYAQITAEAPAPTGFIKAEVRGVLVYDAKAGAHVLVKRKVGAAVEEVRVQLSPDDWGAVKAALAALHNKEVIVTGALAEIPRARDTPFGGLSIVGKFEISQADTPK